MDVYTFGGFWPGFDVPVTHPLSGFSITPVVFIFEPLPTVYYNNVEFVV